MVSVCIATYNGGKYIKEQLDSILIQLADSDEVIISDDYSTDDTLSVIKALNDSRIRIFSNSLKKGVNHNFENAIKNANGDLIFLADQDDIWLSNKIEICVKELIEYDLVVSNCKVVDESENIIEKSYFNVVKSGKGFFKNFYKSTYLGCCLAFKKEILKDVLPMPSNLLLFHDWWFGFISELCYKVKFIDTPCMLYRRHTATNSNTMSTSKYSLFQKIEFRFQLLYYGLIRVFKIRSKFKL
ncbi:glycosyltransferase family 2 protein [Flavobacterium sp. AC]|uniref:Glycosyltransferase family 2 protein n=1 Tax=Flavobacterium azizsancarii TaxID=2961580 RepID=A0ABT4W8F1_9FLAO|nr:glycosyltransferase family 2 protein [Flavobacterium azizsancarii]MDA6068804.1 glycosyltransferase family 2 protein [Flavobacterium azizsancarii]